MSPEDQKALEAIAAAQAKGEDPFGDDEVSTEATTDEVADDVVQPDQADESVTDEVAQSEEPAVKPEPVAQEAAPQPVPEAPPTFRADMPADYKQQRANLLAERATAMKQLMEGELDPEAFAVQEARISDSLEELTAARIRAETLHEANIQGQQRYQTQALNRLISKAKAEVDYAADADARNQFDTALQVVAAQPANQGKDFADLIDTAHTMVKAMRGVMSVPTTQSTKSPSDRKPAGDPPPVTLRSLPSASTPNTGSVVDQIARLKGPAYEAAFAKLTPSQKAALLDAD